MKAAVVVSDPGGALSPRQQRDLALQFGKPVVLEGWDPARVPAHRLGHGILAVTRHRVPGAMTAEDALRTLCRHADKRGCAFSLRGVGDGQPCAST